MKVEAGQEVECGAGGVMHRVVRRGDPVRAQGGGAKAVRDVGARECMAWNLPGMFWGERGERG